MKFSTALILASFVSASAFTAPASKATTSSLRMSEESTSEISEEVATAAIPDILTPKMPPIGSLPDMSQSMPFMSRPIALDGSLVGDVGFDPLGFAKNSEDLVKFREAEIKHGRLAMLAAAGWPISELFDKKIAAMMGLSPLLVGDDRAPSLLNGGLGKISPVYWAACIAGAAAIDLYGTKVASKKADYTPGNLGFDPFGLYPKDKEGQDQMQLSELKNGRLAMLAITAFAFQELVSQIGVINETPLFFKPLGETLHQITNAGYIH